MNHHEMALRHAVERIEQLKPGECVTFDRRFMEYEIGFHRLTGPFGPIWHPADQIMENIIGSAYTIAVTQSPMTLATTFKRLRNPLDSELDDTRTYLSPDHRERGYFKYDGVCWRRVKSDA